LNSSSIFLTLSRGEFDIEYKTGKKIRKTKSQNSKLFGSSVSLDDDRSLADSERGFSASSKFSKKSGDSGLEADYGFIITEDSDPDKVRAVTINGHLRKLST
jgi:hypothetical protein